MENLNVLQIPTSFRHCLRCGLFALLLLNYACSSIHATATEISQTIIYRQKNRVFVSNKRQITNIFLSAQHDANENVISDDLTVAVSLLKIPRGGSGIQLDDDDDDDGAGLIVRKLRNIIRSILGGSESSSLLQTVVRMWAKSVESIFGVRLLPKGKKKATRSVQKSGEKRKKKQSSDEEEERAGAENTKKKSKSKSASSSTTTKPKQTKKAGSKAATAHLKADIKSTSPNYRIQRELKAFLQDPPPNLTVAVGKNIRLWIVTMKGAAGTIYEGETFKLRVQFPAQYPTVPPSVYFLPPNIPVHEHVYTNGDICLSLLGKDWRPTMTAQSIAVSILSILSSASSKSLPMDNARHAQNKPGQYQKDWVYHDDNC